MNFQYLQLKVLLGSDFPTIPHPYAHQLEGLSRLDLGDAWLQAVCWENGAQLFGLTRPAGNEFGPGRRSPVD